MPKTPMDEDGDAGMPEGQVRSAGQIPGMKGIAEAHAVKKTPHDELRPRVNRPDGGHDAGPVRSWDPVHSAVLSGLPSGNGALKLERMPTVSRGPAHLPERTRKRRPSGPFGVVDLFSGCGGLTLGFLWDVLLDPNDSNPITSSVPSPGRSPFRALFANDYDAKALATYRANFDRREAHSVGGSLEDLLDEHDNGSGGARLPDRADVLIGGPPCQGFSLLNKQREGDHRRSLWWHFMEVAERVDAKVIVMENVPQLLGSPEFQAMWCRLRELKYRYVMAHTLCAANYGVPQVRNRAIILASREHPIALPVPTHLSPDRLERVGNGAAQLGLDVTAWLTVAEAFRGLGEPRGTEPRSGVSPAQVLHFGRSPTAKSIERYKAVPPGGNRFDLQRNARELTPTCWVRKTSGGTDLFGRLWAHRPSVTIRTEFFKPEKGRYLHPTAHRPITHREAARLQTFPDGFVFTGSKTDVAKQIGNAVPPLLAFAIARSVADALAGRTDERDMYRARDLFALLLGERVDALSIPAAAKAAS